MTRKKQNSTDDQWQPVNQHEILSTIAEGKYIVDLDLGLVFSRRTGRELYTFSDWKSRGRLFVRVYYQGTSKGIARSRLVWMAGTMSTIPPGWEVHHHNENPADDRFENLFCLHPIDHKKWHFDAFEPSDTPF